ncbi:hybrid sensor histidine kinase/response regulator [Anatilimnocola floriformis]|uniref:hybrid sensor histidine kinase/response regulator n=1 Tax=Anatilimnocola floriformis TaxID=2948575 RepID=UPI0020C38E8C|nr:PAS domain S-box protein [Anatilimnocola floriformis]
MTTATKLWLGFGALFAILAFSSLAIYLRVRSIEKEVAELGSSARTRGIATRQLKSRTLSFYLAVQAHLQGLSQKAVADAEEDAAQLERSLDDYERTAETPLQREMGQRFATEWLELKSLGDELLALKDRPATPEQVSRFYASRVEIERLLDNELQADASANFTAHLNAALQDSRSIRSFTIVLLLSGTIVALASSVVASRSILRNERDLDEQRERLRTTLASIGDAVISTDVDGNVVYLNSVAERLTGWSNQDAFGRPLEYVFKIVNETTREKVENPAVRALRDGVIVGLANHTILVAKHGSETPIDDSAAPIQRADGKIVGCVLVFRDVTERRKSEAALHAAKLRRDMMLVAGEIGTWEFDIVENLVRADHNLAGMFGVTTAEALGGPLAAYTKAIHPDDLPRVLEMIGRALDSQDKFEAEYRILKSNGNIISVIARGAIERDADGKALRMPGVIVDITKQRMAEERLRASELQRQLALESGELGTWNIDPANRALKSDERFRVIYSGRSNDLTYEQAFACIHDDDREKVREAVAAAIDIDNPAPYSSEYRVVHVDGSVRWVGAKGRANFGIRDGHKTLLSFDGVVVDITSERQMADELRELAANLSEVDRRKNEFLAMLAHELRNPLAPMRNALQLVKVSDGHQLQVATDMMDRQINQMVRLVDDLLDVSRISMGKIELRRDRVLLAPIIQQAIESCRPLIDSAKHQLSVHLPTQPIYLNADAVRLTQVFTNILSNACKYTNAGGEIAVFVTLGEAEVAVAVKDSGVGISADMLERVFQMFTQVDESLEKSQGGLGIGLSLVKTLVEMHAGSVIGKSEGPGKGSEFIVRLPILSGTFGSSEKAAPPAASHAKALRILIVDDNRDAASSLAMLLKITGNTLQLAHDGEEAVQVAEAFRPQLILLDIGLPKMNGYEVARIIRKQPWGRDIKLVALTGWGQEEDRLKSAEAGFDVHLVKPADYEVLKKLLAETAEAKVT